MALSINQFEIIEMNKCNQELLTKNLAELIAIDMRTICDKGDKNITHYNDINIKIGDKEIKIKMTKK